MKFTGERFIPDSSVDIDLEIEHLQRYYSVINLVKDKVVVDAACGEGYGSSILAEHAAFVYGVDIAKDVIENARKIYQKTNLNYFDSSVESLPIANNSVDVFISFETIEHVDEVVQNKFLNEIKRVLKKDGILVISTPDKYIYSDLPHYKNEYHVKEFYQQEFFDFLSNYFSSVVMNYQDFQVVSVIGNDNSKYLDILDVLHKDRSSGKYIIAVCGDIKSNANIDTAVLDIDNKYPKLLHRINELQSEVEERNSHIKKLDLFIEEKDSLILELQAREDELSNSINTLEETVKQKTKINELNEEKINKQDEIISLNNTVINELKSQVGDLTRRETAIMKELAETSNQLNETVKQKNEIITNQQGHIDLLLEQERILKNILHSHGWGLLKRYYKIRDYVLPGGSKRKLLARLLFFTLKNPKRVYNMISQDNLRKFFYYSKTENSSILENRIENCLDKYSTKPKLDLQIYEKTSDMPKIIFNKTDKPLVSVVIPVYNQWHYTYSCLQSILENTLDIDYEVIIADDVSSDETVNIASHVENIKVIRDKANLGFLLNCNNAARNATGKYILFLNNDTNVQKDWLKYLVDTIERDKTVGMVGSKLVYPDGRLQEAGGIIWDDASGWNFGRLDDPEKPEYNYVKEVDYISGACIMIRSDLWKSIGGFDERYVPAYFEDSDLAFEVRKHGYKVVFQPKSVVVHFEGISHGTDVSSGVKSHQVKNKDKFKEKWRDLLQKDHFKNGQNVFWAREKSGEKKTILVIDHYVPHYDKDAGSRTTFQYLKLFIEMGLNVKFWGDNFFKHEPYTTELEQLGIEVYYGNWYANNYKQWLENNGKYINYTYLNRPHISIKYIDLIKSFTNSKIFYYGHDLHYLRELREYELSKNKECLKSSEKWKKIEFELFNKADMIYYPSQIEVNEIKKCDSSIKVRAIPAYIFDKFVDTNILSFKERKDLLFVGGFVHKPNIDGVMWFIKEVFPLILSEIPEIKFYIVGSNPPDMIKELQSTNIKVTGFVSDEELERYYVDSRLVVVPLRFGAGVKGKVVEAMYYGMPMVTTSVGAEGLNDIGNILTVADDINDFAGSVIKLYNNVGLLEEKALESVAYVKKVFSPLSVLDVIKTDFTG